MFRKTFRLVYNLGIHPIGTVTGKECNLFLLTRQVHEVIGKRDLKPEDTFGTLARNTDSFPEPDEDEEVKGDYFGKKDSLQKIQACLDANEYHNALDLLKIMQQHERAPRVIYNKLINYNAKVGNPKEAFRLYNDFKKRHYCKTDSIFTSLFVACANCPRPDIALPIAHKVMAQVLQDEENPNLWVYHAMFRAFGKHGEYFVSCQLMDRLREKNIRITSETYSRLLQGCLSDKCSGLKFALMIWHYMLKEKIKPSLFIFRFMAKCIQQCSLGDVEDIKNFLNFIVENNPETKQFSHISANGSHMLGIGQEDALKPVEVSVNSQTDFKKDDDDDDMYNNLFLCDTINLSEASQYMLDPKQTQSNNDNTLYDIRKGQNELLNSKDIKLPNVLHPNPTWGSVVHLGDMSNPYNRFLLFGGFEGFFKVMDHFEVKPDVALFTILLFCIPRTREALEELMKWFHKYNLKMDILFANSMWKRKVDASFQDFRDFLSSEKLEPDWETINVMARLCTSAEEYKEWIEFTRTRNIRIIDRHISALLEGALKSHDRSYISDIVAMAKKERVRLGPKSLDIMKRSLNESKLEVKEVEEF